MSKSKNSSFDMKKGKEKENHNTTPATSKNSRLEMRWITARMKMNVSGNLDFLDLD